MLQRVKEVQESDLRMVGALARNIQRVLAVTQADIDAAAAQGKGWLVKRVVKVNDPLDNLRGGTQLVIKQNSIQPGQNVMRVLYSGNSKTVGPAVAPLSLSGAAAEDILSLIAFGGIQQGGVPVGYQALNGVTNGSGTYIDTGVIPTVDDVEIEIRAKPTTGSWYILQSRASGSVIWGVSGSSSGATILLGWGGTGSLCQSAITRDPTHTYYIKATMNNGTATLYVKDETDNTEDTQTNTYTSAVPSLPFWLYGNQNSDRVNAGNTVYMARIKIGGVTVMDYVPALNPSMVVGFYDKATGYFKVSSEGTLTADQTIVPTPTTPMDIVSNNGTICYSPNMYNKDYEYERIYGFFASSGTTWSYADQGYSIRIACQPNTTYTARYNGNSTQAVLGFGSTSDDNVPTSGNSVSVTQCIRQNSPTINTPITLTTGANDKWLIIAFNVADPQHTDMMENLQLEKGAVPSVYKPYHGVGVYTSGPIETIAIKDDQSATVSTATCEDLLSVGTYTDEQEIISGVVTRKVGVAVLDGTEDIGKSGIYAGSFFVRNVVSDWGTSNNAQVYCSHFSGVTEDTDYAQNKCMILNNAFNMWWASDNTPTVAQFQQWLAAQYAAGTPVIIIYPLATPTTESVTGQPMQTAAGDNTAEITQAGMAGLELEVEYVEA